MNTQKRKQLKCQNFWAKQASFDQLGLISDPHINFWNSWNELQNHKWTEKYKLHYSDVGRHFKDATWQLYYDKFCYAAVNWIYEKGN